MQFYCLMQEPPKEDLTVSEKFQLVLDVAQKAQVRDTFIKSVYRHKEKLQVRAVFQLLFTESFW